MFLGISSPLSYYLYDAKDRHAKNVEESLLLFTSHANVDRAANAKTVEAYNAQTNELNNLNNKVKKQKQARG